MPNQPEKGDKVSWNWGGGAPGGKVAETKSQGEIAIKSKRGNTIKKNASPDNPAVHVSRSGNDVVKRASELNVEQKAGVKKGGKKEEEKDDGKKRKSKTQNNDTDNDDEDGGAEDSGSDSSQPLTENAQGKEVKKGGKQGNKKQKTSKHEDVKGGDDSGSAGSASEDGDDDEKSTLVNGNSKRGGKKGKQSDEQMAPESQRKETETKKKDPAPRKDGDMVSTRTRSQGKAK
ncbi:hypothetical protein GGR57DRAFT_109074 [Xylariaceae sp. FL1272]|nr:hypothetical protein GGR57DRAFT_109074 [Xylariaceae sp. FL1272]